MISASRARFEFVSAPLRAFPKGPAVKSRRTLTIPKSSENESNDQKLGSILEVESPYVAPASFPT